MEVIKNKYEKSINFYVSENNVFLNSKKKNNNNFFVNSFFFNLYIFSCFMRLKKNPEFLSLLEPIGVLFSYCF